MRDDPELIHVVIHALNEWMYETWQFDYEGRIFATPVITLPIVEKAIEELEWVVERGARAVLDPPRAGPGLPRLALVRAPRVRPVLGEGRRARHPRRHAQLRQRLRALHQRLDGHRQRDAPVPAAGVPDAVAVAPDRGRGRRAHLPRRAVPLPAAQGGGDRERQQLGGAADQELQGPLQEDAAGLRRGSGRGHEAEHLRQPVLGGGPRRARRPHRRGPRAVRLRLPAPRGPGRSGQLRAASSRARPRRPSARSWAATWPGSWASRTRSSDDRGSAEARRARHHPGAHRRGGRAVRRPRRGRRRRRPSSPTPSCSRRRAPSAPGWWPRAWSPATASPSGRRTARAGSSPLLGLFQAGAVLVPVNTRFKGPEAAPILERSRRQGARHRHRLPRHRLPGAARARPTPSSPTSRRSSCSTARCRRTRSSWDDLLAGATAEARAEVERRQAAVGPDDPSDILFTSGTTGTPKGVVQTHARTLLVATDWVAMTGLTADDRYLMVNPYFHMFGLKAGILASRRRRRHDAPRAGVRRRPGARAGWPPRASPCCPARRRSTRRSSTTRRAATTTSRACASPSPAPPTSRWSSSAASSTSSRSRW